MEQDSGECIRGQERHAGRAQLQGGCSIAVPTEILICLTALYSERQYHRIAANCNQKGIFTFVQLGEQAREQGGELRISTVVTDMIAQENQTIAEI